VEHTAETALASAPDTRAWLPSPELEDLARRAEDYAAAGRSPNTLRAYRAAWAAFEQWCADHHLSSLPAAPETVALYVADHGDRLKASTLQLRLVAVAQAHRIAGHPAPTTHPAVRAVAAGVRRTHGTAPTRKAPLRVEDLRRIDELLPATTAGTRDRALLLLGFAAALRRSEIVALDVADLELTSAGAVVTIRRSKTDAEARGRRIAVPYGSSERTCPVRAIQHWLTAAEITDGAVFRSVDRNGHVRAHRLTDQTVARIVKRAASLIGADPTRFGGHSLRAGLATSAAAAGVEERRIAEQTGHRSVTVLRQYIREGELFRPGNAAAAVGL
jgi:integrase